jgi:predicted AlkP superfamily pyrophosphatase or phosphodiesterase
MKISFAALLIAVVPALSHAQTAAPARPQHAILLVIDGLSYLAPERVDMPNLKALMARGA